MANSLPNKSRSKWTVRPVHRILGIILLLFTLYFGTTGSIVQLIDLRTIASHAAATDPDMMAIRESTDGTGNFAVIGPTDYAAPALPQGYDFNAALESTLKAAHAAAGTEEPLRYLELRVIDGRPVAQVQWGEPGVNGPGGRPPHILRLDPATGTMLPSPPPEHGGQVPSVRQDAKAWHRLNGLGDQNLWLNTLVGIGLFFMVVTGLVLYFQLLRTRRRAGLKAVFWSAGGWWRSLHRWVSILAAVFLLVTSISGTLLSIDSFALYLYRVHLEPPDFKGGRPPFPPGMGMDVSKPLADGEIPAMLATTLSAYHNAQGDRPIKVLRLRYFAGMPQGVILAGGDDTKQLVYNAETGKRASMTEPGYPYTGFPFGWEEHELMKKIHRGDVIGVPGRVMALFSGFSLIFLSISGLVMYLDLWRRRRKGGRKAPVWV